MSKINGWAKKFIVFSILFHFTFSFNLSAGAFNEENLDNLKVVSNTLEATFEVQNEGQSELPPAPVITGAADGDFYIDVESHYISATLKLYDASDNSVVDIIENAEEYPRFTVNLDGKSYYVTQTVNGVESEPSNIIRAEEARFDSIPNLTAIFTSPDTIEISWDAYDSSNEYNYKVFIDEQQDIDLGEDTYYTFVLGEPGNFELYIEAYRLGEDYPVAVSMVIIDFEVLPPNITITEYL